MKINYRYQRMFVPFMLGLFLTVCSCETVKEYQKGFLNDEDMEVGGRKLESFEVSWENYREGASGGSGTKSGGGCGCN